jgi:hypothetical protein
MTYQTGLIKFRLLLIFALVALLAPYTWATIIEQQQDTHTTLTNGQLAQEPSADQASEIALPEP